ncbi:MAG: GntR family transcriptional regulator [Clostridia bacterium]
MNIIISNVSQSPIYEQVATQIKNNILSGVLSEGEMLPSIRTLAKDLRISVITTKRAYEELEKEGFINTIASKGCFVAKKNTAFIREEYLKQIEEHIAKAKKLAIYCNLTDEELLKMFE